MKMLIFAVSGGTCPETYKSIVNSIGNSHPFGAANAIFMNFLGNHNFGNFHENHNKGGSTTKTAILAPAEP